jgi:hypothetical protein
VIKTFEEFEDKSLIIKEIMDIFRKFKKIFPHMKPDMISQKVDKNDYIYKDGVVILFNVYKKQTKISDNITANVGDVMLNEIVNKFPGNGKTQEVFVDFLDTIKNRGSSRILLTVRKDNYLAINFYKKIGFEEMDKKSWARGTIPGLVFELNI